VNESRRQLKVRIGFALWLLAFGLSLAIALVSEPTGSGFTRGLNRIGTFFRWQFLAFALAIFVWLAGRDPSQAGASAPLLSRIPIYLQCLLGLIGVGIVALAVILR
jgi:hypothetical protein